MKPAYRSWGLLWLVGLLVAWCSADGAFGQTNSVRLTASMQHDGAVAKAVFESRPGIRSRIVFTMSGASPKSAIEASFTAKGGPTVVGKAAVDDFGNAAFVIDTYAGQRVPMLQAGDVVAVSVRGVEVMRGRFH